MYKIYGVGPSSLGQLSDDADQSSILILQSLVLQH